jgi:hypothetical protein
VGLDERCSGTIGIGLGSRIAEWAVRVLGCTSLEGYDEVAVLTTGNTIVDYALWYRGGFTSARARVGRRRGPE